MKTKAVIFESCSGGGKVRLTSYYIPLYHMSPSEAYCLEVEYKRKDGTWKEGKILEFDKAFIKAFYYLVKTIDIFDINEPPIGLFKEV